MTDNEIIKALECCYSVIDLINRQKEENLILTSDLTIMSNNYEHLKAEYQKEQTVSIGRKDRLMQAVIDLQKAKAEIERYLHSIKLLEKDVATARAEAIKDFAERLNKQSEIVYGDRAVCVEVIDNLVKEMTKGKENV